MLENRKKAEICNKRYYFRHMLTAFASMEMLLSRVWKTKPSFKILWRDCSRISSGRGHKNYKSCLIALWVISSNVVYWSFQVKVSNSLSLLIKDLFQPHFQNSSFFLPKYHVELSFWMYKGVNFEKIHCYKDRTYVRPIKCTKKCMSQMNSSAKVKFLFLQ